MQAGTMRSLTPPEISGIWNSYMNDTLSICVFEYFLSNVDDKEIRSILEHSRYLSEHHIIKLKDIFNREGLPIPHGFTKDDVNVNAPRLFTDSFYLWYLKSGVYFGMDGYSAFLNNVSRPDIREYFSKGLTESMDLYNTVVDTLISKGFFINAPKVEVLKETAYVKQDSFLGSWFGEQRSFLAKEVTAAYTKIIYNTVNRALYGGFTQVAASKRVRDFMFKGRELAANHIKSLSDKLNNENIPVPSTSDSFITTSTTAPFSDKLMMYLMLGMGALLLGNTGFALVQTLRKDLHVTLLKNATEDARYAGEGTTIMIDNGWMEQPPQVVRSENLVRC